MAPLFRPLPSLALAAGVLLSQPAAAQMRSVVIPGDSTVVVPPRGSASRLGLPPATANRPPAEEPVERIPADSVLGLNPVVALVPALAAAVLGGSLAGGGGGGGAPARTR